MQVHFLGELPLDPEVRIGGDTGEPIVRRKGVGEPYLELARNAIARLEEAAKDEGPKIEISD
jgi:class 3 adenylate cyclase